LVLVLVLVVVALVALVSTAAAAAVVLVLPLPLLEVVDSLVSLPLDFDLEWVEDCGALLNEPNFALRLFIVAVSYILSRGI
jgi:hypothetical protein